MEVVVVVTGHASKTENANPAHMAQISLSLSLSLTHTHTHTHTHTEVFGFWVLARKINLVENVPKTKKEKESVYLDMSSFMEVARTKRDPFKKNKKLNKGCVTLWPCHLH